MNINEKVSAPILVTVRHGLLFKSWRLPYVDEDSIKHFDLDKTFCLSKEDQNSEVMIEVTNPQCGKYVTNAVSLKNALYWVLETMNLILQMTIV